MALTSTGATPGDIVNPWPKNYGSEAHEVEAVATAKPTPGASALVRAWKRTGCKQAIVSNNSTAAIDFYLRNHELSELFDVVVGRRTADVEELKPAPYLIAKSVQILQVDPRACTLLGDSDTDVDAALDADVVVVGFANKPGKIASLGRRKPQLIVTQLADLLDAVHDQDK